MYKKMRNFLVIVTVISISLIGLSIFIINKHTYFKIEKSYEDTKINQLEYFIDENFEDLNNLIISHAVWTDAINAMSVGDVDWMYNNASGYIVDDENLNIDYIYTIDEVGKFDIAYSQIGPIDVESIKGYKKALINDEPYQEVIWSEEQAVLIVSSPFYDDDYDNPYGCYIIGRVLQKEDFVKLEKLLSKKSIQHIQTTKLPINDITLLRNQVEINHQIINNSEAYFYVVFSIEYLDYLYNGMTFLTLVIVLLVAIVVVTILISNMKKLSMRLTKVIEVVKDISTGNYHIKLGYKKSKWMPEINQLIESINIMSDDIESHIETIESHSKIIDERYFDMIELLVDTVEMNDSYTYHHSVSVSDFALLIGRAIEFDDLENLELASKLHDIGKISIATDILNKPGKLTKEEYEIIKTHSSEGYKLLNKIEKFEVAKYGVLYHHEHYNGKGYPDGLKGDEIPMIAQIIAVADVYDALTSDRAYRDALTCRDAMNILIEEKGKMLNPKLVDIFYEEIRKSKDCSHK